MAGFADAIRPDKFISVSFKRWQVKCQLWLMPLKIFHVSKGMPEITISEQDQEKFWYDNTAFKGCILSVLDG